MGSKRKPESPLRSEPSHKIRRITTASDQGGEQDSPIAHSSPPREQAAVPPPSSTPAPLTKKNLRRLEKMTGSRGQNTASSAASTKSGTTAASDTKTCSTTDPEFETRFRTNGGVSVLRSRKHPPVNKEEVEAYAFKSRESASPSSSQHDRFIRGLERAANERDMEALFSGRILKDTNKVPEFEDMDYGANIDKQWVAYPKDVGFNKGLSAPKPDLTEGYLQRAYPPNIRQLGGSATLVKNDPEFVALPHFVAEFKDFGKNVRQGEVQAGYDGAAMLYARNNALASIGQPDPPGRASPITVATDGRTWRTYVHYAEENKDTKQTEYFQYQVAFGDMTSDEDLRRGYRVLRNAQDWGRKESTELRDRMQRHYEANGTQPGGVASGRQSSASASSSRQQAAAPSSAKSPAAPRAPSSPPASAAKAAAKTAAKTAASRPPPSDASSSSSKRAGKQPVPPLESKAMPPPPASKRDETQRLLPPGAKAAPRSASSVSSSGSRTETPRSTSSASSASGERRQDRRPGDADRRLPDDRDRDRYRPRQPEGREPAPGRDRDEDRYRGYRDRRSDDGAIEPVQRRRSDSPQDRDRSRDHRDDRHGSGSGSSTAGSSRASGKVVVPPPPKPKGGIFSGMKKPKGHN